MNRDDEQCLKLGREVVRDLQKVSRGETGYSRRIFSFPGGEVQVILANDPKLADLMEAAASGEYQVETATPPSQTELRNLTGLLMIAMDHISDAGSIPAASTTCGGALVSTECREVAGGNEQATDSEGANHKGQTERFRPADGCLESSLKRSPGVLGNRNAGCSGCRRAA